jgi:TRAP-type C4-dicarboxylate transport system permease small subunit
MPANLIKTLDLITEILLNLVGLFLFLFTTTVFLQVFTRFVIQIPLAWTEEVSRDFFIWMVFFGIGGGDS